ncbi:probable G-protein coupled receptor 148 [Brachionichthys hirsutus]|uniref:probable G-protein coupled receptor 148 n=1 Tax=Brachionichthys hirsutus TaxID=412623 RepID=UPI003604D36C
MERFLSSGHQETVKAVTTNASQHLPSPKDKVTALLCISNLTEDWMDSLQRLDLEFFIIPTTVITLGTLLANPLLLLCIFLTRALRRETRYLLVANTLAADILFLVLNLATIICNTVRVQIPRLVCELITAATVTAYCCAVLTVTLMVVDTYVAVRWPLRYHVFLSPARTRRVLVGLWALAAAYPFALVIMTERADSREKVAVCLVLISFGFMQLQQMFDIHVYFLVAAIICAVLIFYCYVRLYMVTRTRGIWQSRFSRARVTLLTHGLLLLLYFAPGFVFTLELVMFHRKDISQDLRVWVSTVNMCVFMLLPRAFAPYLYGLRYREISDRLMQMLFQQRLTLSTFS